MGRSSIKKLEVGADGTGISSRAGAALLALAAERLGLTDGLAWVLAETRERRSAHDRGRVFCDLAVMLADGGRCVSDLVALGSQPALFGDVASVSTARRGLLSVGEAELDRLRRARARARARAWAAGAAPEEVILDFDATPITAHSDKEGAAGHYKGGFGFHPLCCGREVLAAILRPGNAGANNADDPLRVFELALAQLPPAALAGPILVRSDSAGPSHAFAGACRETRARFSFGYAIDQRVRSAILGLPERSWRPAINAEGQAREGAWVAELTGHLALDGRPAGSRLTCRRERPHPGAQLSFTDHDGHRFQCFITGQPGHDLASLKLRHREHAVVEDRVRALKSTGLSNLPFSAFAPNQAWLEAALIAHDLTVWTQLLLFDGATSAASPSACVTGCCTSPGASPATPAGSRCTCPPTGPGPARSHKRSSASPRCPPDRSLPHTPTSRSNPAASQPRSRVPPHVQPPAPASPNAVFSLQATSHH